MRRSRSGALLRLSSRACSAVLCMLRLQQYSCLLQRRQYSCGLPAWWHNVDEQRRVWTAFQAGAAIPV